MLAVIAVTPGARFNGARSIDRDERREKKDHIVFLCRLQWGPVD